MEVGTSGTPSVTNSANGLATLDTLSAFNKTFTQVGKFSGIAVTVPYLNILSIAAIHKRFSDLAISCGNNLLANATFQVNTGMIAFSAIDRISTVTKAGCNVSWYRPPQW